MYCCEVSIAGVIGPVAEEEKGHPEEVLDRGTPEDVVMSQALPSVVAVYSLPSEPMTTGPAKELTDDTENDDAEVGVPEVEM